ncbi:MAG: hypothetical protein JNK09_11930 [Prolixibacteraceae bacterium]|nr:hypothetical protein [Prolixibacteraceae bacterium]
MSNSEIRFIEYKNIDYKKWDQCIGASPFGIAYAFSWYLDRICPHWDALVWGDYLYVMPLVNASKMGIGYVYQPFFTQQLGVFSNFPPEPEIVNSFLNAIPEKFRLTDMKLNLGNRPTSKSFQISENKTYHLNLQTGLEFIQKNYNTNTKRNIQKAIQNKVFISPVYDIPMFLDFTQSNLKLKSPEVKPKHFSALQKVISFALYNQTGEIYGAWDSTNSLTAAAFFVTTNQKSIYLAASSNSAGTEQSAMFLLIDQYIQNNAGKHLILDFEGSNLPGVARFYAGFGATPQTYFSVHQNRLPQFLRFLKK